MISKKLKGFTDAIWEYKYSIGVPLIIEGNKNKVFFNLICNGEEIKKEL